MRTVWQHETGCLGMCIGAFDANTVPFSVDCLRRSIKRLLIDNEAGVKYGSDFCTEVQNRLRSIWKRGRLMETIKSPTHPLYLPLSPSLALTQLRGNVYSHMHGN